VPLRDVLDVSIHQRRCLVGSPSCRTRPELRPQLESVTDPRAHRGWWYSLTAISLVRARAALGEAKSIDELAEFGERATPALLASLGIRRHLLGWRPSPRPVTIGRVLAALDGEALDQAVGAPTWPTPAAPPPASPPPERGRSSPGRQGPLKGSARLDTPRRHLLSAVTHSPVATLNTDPVTVPLRRGGELGHRRHRHGDRRPGGQTRSSDPGRRSHLVAQGVRHLRATLRDRRVEPLPQPRSRRHTASNEPRICRCPR
jgi:hypothetical protein